jgi:putative peptidoglycan lipid II flippase
VLREILRLGGWTIGYVVANQVALVVVLRLASGLDPGAITAYQTAFIFFQLPHGLLAVSIMTSTTPELARAAQKGDRRMLSRRYREGGAMLLTLMIPAAAGLALLGYSIVQIVLERGLFDHEDTVRTGRTIVAMALGLPGFSVYLYSLRVFYARRDTKTPFFLILGENVTNIVVAVALIGLDEAGLGLAFAVAYTLAAGVTVVTLERRVPGLISRSWRPLLVRIGIVSALTVTPLLVVRGVLGDRLTTRPFVDVVVAVVLAAVVWLTAVTMLRIDGFEPLTRRVRAALASFGGADGSAEP